ncbi:Uncharacterized integral membrane protein [Evansella caseinilytica]|uniref:Uncharacterized integral membrane protein n=1 Tax=Evansella caseinilytica TaxID=1503961 RepID=A0A1H3K8P5_9BACI|nr:lipopolysaccharide assembly protein LapA domain-containing protein [Evansella caseinilytica]SDY47854.1 Uncharacterized integral membrane protein [Evansella caseinilytica]
MKGQWTIIISIVVVLLIAVFAVINVEPVEVNYLFGKSEWPLVLVILSSVLMGGVIVGSAGMYKMYRLQQELKRIKSGTAEKDTAAEAMDKKNSE